MDSAQTSFLIVKILSFGDFLFRRYDLRVLFLSDNIAFHKWFSPISSTGKIPSEVITDYARLPLVELPLTVRPQSTSSKSGGSESVTNLAATEKTEVKSPSGKKDRDKSSKTPEPSEAPEEEQKPR